MALQVDTILILYDRAVRMLPTGDMPPGREYWSRTIRTALEVEAKNAERSAEFGERRP
jgi:hypothetical protein